jgi:hypothetical protein
MINVPPAAPDAAAVVEQRSIVRAAATSAAGASRSGRAHIVGRARVGRIEIESSSSPGHALSVYRTTSTIRPGPHQSSSLGRTLRRARSRCRATAISSTLGARPSAGERRGRGAGTMPGPPPGSEAGQQTLIVLDQNRSVLEKRTVGSPLGCRQAARDRQLAGRGSSKHGAIPGDGARVVTLKIDA